MRTSLYVNFGQTATRSARELRPWQTDDGSGHEAMHVHGLMYNLSSLTSLPLHHTHVGLNNQQDKRMLGRCKTFAAPSSRQPVTFAARPWSARDPARTKRFVDPLALASEVGTTRSHQTQGMWHYDSSEEGCVQPMDRETLLAQTRQRPSCAELALVLHIRMLERIIQAQRNTPRKHLVRCQKLHKTAVRQV